MGRAVNRARQDLEQGRLWKARDRLTGSLANAPTDQEALNLLGEVYQKMGDMPAAGAVWFLSVRDDAESQAAGEAFRERFGNDPARMIDALPIKAEIDGFPPPVAARLRDLFSEAGLHPRLETKPPRSAAAKAGWWACCLILVLVGLFVVVALSLGIRDLAVTTMTMVGLDPGVAGRLGTGALGLAIALALAMGLVVSLRKPRGPTK